MNKMKQAATCIGCEIILEFSILKFFTHRPWSRRNHSIFFLKINFELLDKNEKYFAKEMVLSEAGIISFPVLKLNFEFLGKNEKQAGTELGQAQPTQPLNYDISFQFLCHQKYSQTTRSPRITHQVAPTFHPLPYHNLI